MSHITKARGAALASVCRIVTAADRHGQETVSVQELRVALAGVDVDGLADPRPPAAANVGRPLTPVVAARA